MLPHGGSRLNASKPETNPKTRCPSKRRKLRKRFTFTFTLRSGSRLLAACYAESGPTTNTLSNRHSRYRAPRAPRRRKVKHMITRFMFILVTTTMLARTCQTQVAEPWLEQKTLNYVPLQTREHAWAGISGMLRASDSGGAFTSRDAKPRGLDSCSGTSKKKKNSLLWKKTSKHFLECCECFFSPLTLPLLFKFCEWLYLL